VTGTDVGITQQTDATPTNFDVTWTQIEVSQLTVDDGFTDVGTTISWEATATYAHQEDGAPVPVPQATLTLGDSAPSTCTLDEGTVTGGSLYANVTCSDVVDAEIPIAIATADDEVTQLAEPLNLVDTERDENPVWTGLDVQYETTDENGETIGDGELLDHEEPVRFEGTVQFAHLADGDGTAPPVNSVEFQVRNAADDVVSNCASDIDDNGAGTCVTEIRRTDGTHTFGIGAASFDEGDNGFPKRDVTEVLTDPGEVAFRWTSIAFQAFACEGSVNPDRTCEDDFESQDDGTGERVTVTVTAVAADTGEVLSDATITIDGNEETTNEAGQASRDFYTFQAPTCIDVTATGVEATIDGETIDWDTPRTEEICWG
jgi:hypothetical protein